MIRRGALYILPCLFLFGAGCEQSPESRPEATLAKGGLMPTGLSEFESIYVADQSSIKVFPEPVGLSYAPLDSFTTNKGKGSEKKSADGNKKKKKGPIGRTKEAILHLFGG